MNHIARTPKQIGAIVQRQRRLRNLNQSVLASLAGSRQETISKFEGGNPATRLDTLFDLLAALDLELAIIPRGKGSSKEIEEIF
jgi:HTH-type transcriptional regulator/antitoxin HipB